MTRMSNEERNHRARNAAVRQEDECDGKPVMVEMHLCQHLSLADIGKTYAGKPRSGPENRLSGIVGGFGNRSQGSRIEDRGENQERNHRTPTFARPKSIPPAKQLRRTRILRFTALFHYIYGPDMLYRG